MRGLSVREAAIELSTSTKWIYDLLYAGRIPGAIKVGRAWRIPRAAIRQRKAARAADQGAGVRGLRGAK